MLSRNLSISQIKKYICDIRDIWWWDEIMFSTEHPPSQKCVQALSCSLENCNHWWGAMESKLGAESLLVDEEEKGMGAEVSRGEASRALCRGNSRTRVGSFEGGKMVRSWSPLGLVVRTLGAWDLWRGRSCTSSGASSSPCSSCSGTTPGSPSYSTGCPSPVALALSGLASDSGWTHSLAFLIVLLWCSFLVLSSFHLYIPSCHPSLFHLHSPCRILHALISQGSQGMFCHFLSLKHRTLSLRTLHQYYLFRTRCLLLLFSNHTFVF